MTISLWSLEQQSATLVEKAQTLARVMTLRFYMTVSYLPSSVSYLQGYVSSSWLIYYYPRFHIVVDRARQ